MTSSLLTAALSVLTLWYGSHGDLTDLHEAVNPATGSPAVCAYVRAPQDAQWYPGEVIRTVCVDLEHISQEGEDWP